MGLILEARNVHLTHSLDFSGSEGRRRGDELLRAWSNKPDSIQPRGSHDDNH
jgi:hypothetical protein